MKLGTAVKYENASQQTFPLIMVVNNTLSYRKKKQVLLILSTWATKLHYLPTNIEGH